MSRRSFLARVAGASIALPSAGAILAACDNPASTSAAAARPLARPDSPVTLPLEAEPIDASTPIEAGATLIVYNWADYVWKKTLAEFEERFDCTVEYTSFLNLEEAIVKIQSGQIKPDVYFPGPSYLGRLALGGLVQPLNHELIPNMEANVWTSFWDPGPWYDRGWRYSVPYTALTTGVAYRRDLVDDDEAASQGYELLWNAAYTDRISYYDSERDALGMAILRNGDTDVNTGDPAVIDAAKAAIVELIQDYGARLTYNGVYAKLPEGEFTVAQAWSGDIIGAQWFLPKGTSTDVLGYWYPGPEVGLVGNDIMTIPTNAQNPRLAHEFINFLLDEEVAFDNFAYWTGYTPPLYSIDPTRLVDEEVIPPQLVSAVLTEEMMQSPNQLGELSSDVEGLWQAAWAEISTGA